MLNIYEVDAALAGILARKPIDEFPVTPAMRERTIKTFGEDIPPEEVVRRILKDVRKRGDAAVCEWTRKLDGIAITPDQFEVIDEDFAVAYDQVDSEVVAALERAAERISAFHARNPAQSWMNTEMGGLLGQLIRPLERAGVYVPGGTAPLASTLLMTAIVARQAGVKEIIVCAPPTREPSPNSGRPVPHPAILVAADIAGVDAVYAVGGVQAIGAMAYGTDTIAYVDKICGPGNAFVVLAKKEVFGTVGIDSLPGPTETVVIAEDLLEAVAVADSYAPEHLCLSVRDPWAWVGKIRNAGGVFVGEHSYEVLGDYCAGPSHVMPTGGTANFTSPLNVLDFVRVMNVIALDEETSRGLGPIAVKMAEAEGLAAHAAAARIRE